MARRVIFAVSTPLGYRVVLTRNRWREIVRYKHPALAAYQEQVRRCVEEPEVVRASTKDPEVHMYYATAERGYVCVVVGYGDPSERLVVTAYFTKTIKRGDELWTK
jgi:hypothetical protein